MDPAKRMRSYTMIVLVLIVRPQPKGSMILVADAKDPTGDFVDFHAPRNLGGEGSRVAGGSSFGSDAGHVITHL